MYFHLINCFNFQVPCILQYWDALLRRFIDYKEFKVSETECVQVVLPSTADLPIINKDTIAAEVWRIVILHPRDRDPTYDLNFG